MSRHARHVPREAFAPDGEFQDQLYDALRSAPWWMISIAVHLVLFLILNMIPADKPKKPVPPAIAAVMAAPEDPPQEDPPETPIDNPKDLTDVSEVEPTVTKDDPTEDESIDQDLDDSEPYGQETGFSDSQLEGPSENSHIGLQGGAGGNPFKGRGTSGDGGGGPSGKRRDDAVMDALRWLQAHQSPNGGWEAAGFQRWCDGRPLPASEQTDGLGKAMYDPGVTGLALCAFLGAGYTNRGNHPFKQTVSRGLRYLKNVQDAEGCFGARASSSFIYNHATAALAMVEAYGMTHSPIFKESAQRAISFIGLTRNPYFVWRYGVKPGDNDTSVTGWMMMAVKSAKLINEEFRRAGKAAPLAVDDNAFEGINAWLDKMTDPDYGRVGYITRGSPSARPKELVDRFPAEKSEAMTAVGVLARIFMGQDPREHELLRKGADLCLKLPPVWDEAAGTIDMYYWYYGALAMFQMGGKHWAAWKKGLEQAVVGTQHKAGSYCGNKGSWDPIGPWGEDGGRVYSTAMLAMCLQVWYRYDRVIGTR